MARNPGPARIAPANEEDRSAAERRRLLSSTEHLWRGHRQQLRQQMVSAISHRVGPSRGSGGRAPDWLKDLDPQMEARVALVADADFKPTRYPNLRPKAQNCGDGGWIAWCILAELRPVPAFAEHHKDA